MGVTYEVKLLQPFPSRDGLMLLNLEHTQESETNLHANEVNLALRNVLKDVWKINNEIWRDAKDIRAEFDNPFVLDFKRRIIHRRVKTDEIYWNGTHINGMNFSLLKDEWYVNFPSNEHFSA